jgi:uncharacterized RDD family membrane protein YckC
MTILDQPVSSSRPIVYATFGERVVARIIDGAIILIPSLFLPFVFAWFYFALQEGSASGATIGKRVMGIRVISTDGQPIGFGTATGRFFSNLLNLCTCLFGCFLMLFNARSQCLHDIITSTVVVKDDPVEPRPVAQTQSSKRSWTAKTSDTDTHFVEINANGGRHWHRSPMGEQVNDFTLWQLTDGMIDFTAEFGPDASREMKAFAEQMLRSKA